MRTRNFIIYTVGIFVSYLYYGILQEKVTRGKYSYEVIDEDGKKTTKTEIFTYTLTLVCLQCAINCILAKIVLTIRAQEQDNTTKLYYASVSTTYLLGMIGSNMALQWVSYPTQVIGKSAKPIPVMILGALLGRKSYTYKKYIFVFLIVIGIVIFMLKENSKVINQDSKIGFGELLLFLSLIMDGLTGAIQERIRANWRPSGLQMMSAINGWSTLYLIFVILISNEGYKFLIFAQKFPFLWYNLMLIGVTSAVGQLFIYSMVSEFGPLPLSIVTTARKFFTILGSVIIFGNSLTLQQWFGAVLVFAALFLDAYFSNASKKSKSKITEEVEAIDVADTTNAVETSNSVEIFNAAQSSETKENADEGKIAEGCVAEAVELKVEKVEQCVVVEVAMIEEVELPREETQQCSLNIEKFLDAERRSF